MTKTEKLEITKEIDRIVHKYPRPDSSELFRSELEYLVEVVKKSLQKPTEEKPTVATVLAYEQWYKEALSKVSSILKKEKCVWVPYRNWIERWIEVAEELLANSV